MISIPIARSINPDDSVDLTRLSSLNSTKHRCVLGGSWTVPDSSLLRSRQTGEFPEKPYRSGMCERHIAILLGWHTTVSPHKCLYRRVEMLLKCAFRQGRPIESEYKPTYRTTRNQADEVLGHLAGIFIQ